MENLEQKSKQIEKIKDLAIILVPVIGDLKVHRIYNSRREALGVDVEDPDVWNNPNVMYYKNLQIEEMSFFFVKYAVPTTFYIVSLFF
jgi:hypothetical protein